MHEESSYPPRKPARMATPHKATVFHSHDEANADNRRTVEFNEVGTRAEFDAAVCMALMGTTNAGPGKVLRYEGIKDGTPGGGRFPFESDECPMDTDWVAVFVEDAPGAESMLNASGALNAHIQGAHRDIVERRTHGCANLRVTPLKQTAFCYNQDKQC